VPALIVEEFNDETSEFVYTTLEEAQTLELEHSLVTLSKWESKWCKPFLSNNNTSDEELLDYVKIMTVTPNVAPDVYNRLSEANVEEIKTYIQAPMTATTFSNDKTSKASREVVTAEIIYYWMIALNIPFECQNWHLNRLITLIKVCNLKNQPPKKMGKRSTVSQYAQLNAARRKQHNSKG
jgi:hypothetical protein